MDETRKVITEDVAVSELPEKVRGDFDADDVVRVTLEAKPVAATGSAEPRYLKFAGIAAYKNTSIEEAVARVRALRDEWD
jgi:hypothetical protein